jgi:hypothetical protein
MIRQRLTALWGKLSRQTTLATVRSPLRSCRTPKEAVGKAYGVISGTHLSENTCSPNDEAAHPETFPRTS